MKEILEAIGQVGFPIVVSVLLLVRIETKMESLGAKIQDLKDVIIKLTTIIDERMTRRK